MATLEELYSLNADGALLNKITAAMIIAAYDITAEDPGTTNHAERIVWAKSAFMAPKQKAQEMLYYLLGANSAATVGNISGANDAAIQTAVNSAVNFFAV